MGRTFAQATIHGPKASKEYSFLVDTGSTHMGLPIEQIEELGLTLIPDGKRRFITATGLLELDTYVALGIFGGVGFSATVIPTPVPLLGYKILESLRFRVNPVTQQLEEVPEDEPHPPYLLPLLSP
jgi:predicted aspartyl protease